MRTLLVLTAAASGIFIWLTCQHMPPNVASHFGVHGQPNGHEGRANYIGLMLLAGTFLPLLLGLGTRMIANIPGARINIPNRDYWLAPPRRAQTLQTLQNFSARLGILIAIFMAYVNWLVVRANATEPHALPQIPFLAGLAIFTVTMIGLTSSLRSRFRIPQL
jgi:TRAP-type C4-dicarboxylate transport system permease small subunit